MASESSATTVCDLAAAHAACYRMGLSHELDQVGHPQQRLEAPATLKQ
jgi:organic hydroperoxide reductase OsmC/OhrA